MFLILPVLIFLLTLYATAIFLLFRGLNRLPLQKPNGDTPYVSVIVSAHNEEKNIRSCLNHLSAQDYPANRIEFIIVDDRSSDKTLDIINSFKEKDRRFRSLSIEDRIPEFAPKKRAIDAGIQVSRGTIILHTDADGRPGPGWVRYMCSYFQNDADMVLGYAPYNIPRQSFTGKLLALEYFSHASVAAATTGLGYPVTCVGTNIAYKKALYREIGGFGKFKPFISGDDDLFLTIVRGYNTYKIAYALSPETHVYNSPPGTFMKFFHQRMRYASKGFYYQPKLTAILTVYFLMNVLLLGSIPLAFTGLLSGFAVTGITGIKILIEYLFMKKAGTVLGDTRSLRLLIPASLIHIPYVVLFGLLGQFKYFKWAEEHSERAIQQYANS